MNYNDYNEVINGTLTSKEIALQLKKGNDVVIGWTDEEYTHNDIFFALRAEKYGDLQRGIKADDLFIGIIGHSFFGFKADSTKDIGYYSEKLGGCTEKQCKLFNGIIYALNGGYSDETK